MPKSGSYDHTRVNDAQSRTDSDTPHTETNRQRKTGDGGLGARASSHVGRVANGAKPKNGRGSRSVTQYTDSVWRLSHNTTQGNKVTQGRRTRHRNNVHNSQQTTPRALPTSSSECDTVSAESARRPRPSPGYGGQVRAPPLPAPNMLPTC